MDISVAVRIRPHTINRFRLAAHQRFRESEELFRAGEFAGAIYLYGYVAELLLKSAFLNLLPNVLPNTSVSLGVLRAEYANAINLGVVGTHRRADLHDLLDLFEAAARKRQSLGRAYSTTFRNRIENWLTTVSRQHLVEMRYYPLRPSRIVAEQVRGAVVAVREAYRSL